MQISMDWVVFLRVCLLLIKLHIHILVLVINTNQNNHFKKRNERRNCVPESIYFLRNIKIIGKIGKLLCIIGRLLLMVGS